MTFSHKFHDNKWNTMIVPYNKMDDSDMLMKNCAGKRIPQDPCYVTDLPNRKNMNMELVRFPALGRDTSGSSGGLQAKSPYMQAIPISSQYTPYEWTQMNLLQYNDADTNRNSAERLRSDAVRLLRETEEKTFSSQRDTNRRISERLNDITFWKNELETELERILAETHLLQDVRRALEKAKQDCEHPLHTALECLYHREGRQGIDKVRDHVEEALMQEVSTLRTCQERLDHLRQRSLEQLQENRHSQHELELDLKSKESALDIDTNCYQLNNCSKNINYFIGIDKLDQTVTVPESWAEHSHQIIQKSQSRRVKSIQLRSESENTMNECANHIWNAWNFTNNALSRRANEILEAKNKLQMHLYKTQQEIYDIEKSIEMIKKAITDKSNPLKVAHTRLEFRTHRREVELCRDNVQSRLQREVSDLETNIHYLQQKLAEAENQHQKLLITRSNLEKDLKLKIQSLFIDKDKCLGIRKACPVIAYIKC